MSRRSFKYADRIRQAAGKVSQQASYPSRNYLADQLKIVARLIRGAQAATLTVDFDGTGLPNGVYYVRLQNEAVQDVRPMLKVR